MPLDTTDDDIAALEALLAGVPEEEGAVLIGSEHEDFTNALIAYARLRGLYDRAKEVKNKADKAVEAMEAALIPLFEKRNVKSVKIAGVGLIGTAENNNPKVVNNDLLYKWLYDVGEEGLIKSNVNYMSLKAMLNARIADKKSIPPPDVCELTSGKTLKLTRAK